MAGIHMVKVEIDGMDMVEEHPSNHQPEDEGTDMVEEHPSNHRPEDEGMDMVEKRPLNHWPKVQGIDREDIDMVEDMTMEVEVVER
jgi:hypothetical protein